MKVLFTLTPAFNPNAGGVQRTTYKLGKFFTEQGYEVAYYSSALDGHITVEYGQLIHAAKTGGVNDAENIQKLRDYIHRFRPNVVINQMPYETPLREALAEEKGKIGYVLLGCLRNSLFNFKNNARDRIRQMMPQPLAAIMDNPLGESLVKLRHKRKHGRDLRAIIDRHDFFVLLAPPNRDELKYFVGDYKPDKVVAIPNSIPEVLTSLPAKEKFILHVGRLNIQQKRSDLLLPFWEKVHRHLPDWQFIVVGDGPYYTKLKADVESKKIPRMALKGYQQPEHYYEKSAIFMMPSAYEGFPNTLIEAQSYGCVPLAYDNYAALQWIVNDGIDAHLITPFDVEEMGEKTKVLAGNPVRLAEMQEAALHNARRFTIDQVGQQWLAFFEKFVVDESQNE